MTHEEKSNLLEMMHDLAAGFTHYTEHQYEEDDPSMPFWASWSEMRRELTEENDERVTADENGCVPFTLTAAEVARFRRLIKAMRNGYSSPGFGNRYEGDELAHDIAEELARVLGMDETVKAIA